MFKKQSSFTLNDETKTLIIGTAIQNNIVGKVFEGLNIDASALEGNYTKTLHTLGKLPSKKVVLIDEEALNDHKKRPELINGLGVFKEDAIVLLDAFDEANMELFGEAIGLSQYTFDEFKTKKTEKGTVHYHTASDATAFENGLVMADATNFTKDLVNRPYNALNAEKLGDIAKELESIDNVSVKVLGKKDIEKMKMGAFLGVNKGSTDEPKLIHVTYEGDTSKQEKTALVGKGIMFDTGGYSLKGVQSMPSMKMDMGGAASVLGAIKAAATLGYKANISAIIAATDNRIGDDAILPDDVLTSANGKTIEIISTDAEGRLTLADALWYAQKEGATRIIDIATLTGSVIGALGDTITGAFSNHSEFYQTFEKTANEAGELVWRLPIGDEHKKSIETPFADIKNSGGRKGGASIAAAFLEHFVDENTPWIHLDIAGTAFDSTKGAKGPMVKTMAKLFE